MADLHVGEVLRPKFITGSRSLFSGANARLWQDKLALLGLVIILAVDFGSHYLRAAGSSRRVLRCQMAAPGAL